MVWYSFSPFHIIVASHWDIVQLALKNEKSHDEHVQRAAEKVLQCFSPTHITFARLAMEEN